MIFTTTSPERAMLILATSSCLNPGEAGFRFRSQGAPRIHGPQPRGVYYQCRRGNLKGYRDFYRQKVKLYDDHVGRVIDRLKKLGLWDNTIVVNTSDHGDMDTFHRLVFRGPSCTSICYVSHVDSHAWSGEAKKVRLSLGERGHRSHAPRARRSRSD